MSLRNRVLQLFCCYYSWCSYRYYYYYYYYYCYCYHHHHNYHHHHHQLHAGYFIYVNYVSYVSSVAALQYSKFTLQVMLFPMLNVLSVDISTSRCMCALLSTAVLRSSLISPLPGMLIRLFSECRWHGSNCSLPSLVSLSFLHSTCFVCLLSGLCILEFSLFISWSHFCLMKLRYLFIYMLQLH